MRGVSTRIGVAVAAVAVAGALGAGDASAQTKVGWVGPTPPGANNQVYLTTSTINNAPLEASSRIYTGFGNSVASGYMGVQARLFKSGVLCQITDYQYNVGPANQISTNTYGNCGSGSYNSHGFVKYWTGTEYGDFLTFPTDPLNFTAPAAATARTTTGAVETGRNTRGQSFGTAETARTDDAQPDLIAAFTTDGKQGFVRKTDLVGETPSSPAAAAAHRAGHRSISVVDRDGTTVVGTFTVS
ncbi:hypothetical protein [Williamsia sterculiae]|nr:hypothetical protein [Williamsia sterculiae]